MDLAFICLFMLMITLPLLMLNVTPQVESEQENRMLTEWPGFGFNSEINAIYEHYFEDRIGFRTQAVTAYTKLTYGLFGEFAEDLHMFGKSGYVFPADEGYIGAYQRLRTDERLIGDFSAYLQHTNEYLQQKGIPFVFLAGLDKKTVYSEYMPDYIHVLDENESIMESLTRHLESSGVPYVIPIEEFEKAKATEQIYNHMYDCAHWNTLGKMIAVRLVDEQLRQQGLDVPVIREDDYELSYETMERLEFLDIRISEQVPVLSLKGKLRLKQDADLSDHMWHVGTAGLQYYRNPKSITEKTLLVFHDSFLDYSKEFYCNRYRQVLFVTRQNYESVQYYVNLFYPDAVIFENAERAFVDDLYAYTNLANVQYEPPYESWQNLTNQTADFGMRLTNAQNALYKEAESKADPVPVTVDDSRSFFVLQGEISLPEELGNEISNFHLYAKYNKNYYEINYPALREGQPGIWEQQDGGTLPFYINMRKTKKTKGKMQIILVDENTHTRYKVGALQIQHQKETVSNHE